MSRKLRSPCDWPTSLSVVAVLLVRPGVPGVVAAQSEPSATTAEPDIGLVEDPAPREVTGGFREGSHVKLFLPNLPYLAVSHAINASLVRPARSDRGWQYDLAVDHRNIGDRVWEFRLRRNVRFQDGSPFDADAVLLNMEHFRRAPFEFTKLAAILDRVEKVDDHTVRFHLTEPYGVFLHDAMWLQFYTRAYLEKHGWNGKPTCPNLAEPGPFGLGPYVLEEGYLEGDRSTPKLVLAANRDYWGDEKPKVETITLYTDLTISEARSLALLDEGRIDITPVPFGYAAETVLSPYAKLVVSPSLNGYAMHINLINGNPALADERVRAVINHAIDQEYLLNLSMVGEGLPSPTTVSPLFYRVGDAIRALGDDVGPRAGTADHDPERLRSIIRQHLREGGLDPDRPLELTMLVQESFLFLTRDIRHFLSRVGIDLELEVVTSEKEVFRELLRTYESRNERSWDLLLWGNYDWYKHPWSAFFVYRPGTPWSTLPHDDRLVDLTERLLRVNVESDEYVPLVAELIRYVHERNYMVFLPTPHNVYAVNKEVVFTPGRSAFVYLRELEVTDHHWSLRGDRPYPADRRQPRRIGRPHQESSAR